MINTAKYKEEGAQAYMEGKEIFDNPYSFVQEYEFASAWHDGYLDKKEEFEETA